MRTRQEKLRLPKDYKFNTVQSNETIGTEFWSKKTTSKYTYLYQEPLYKYAVKEIEGKDCKTIVDLGCGTGHKTKKFLNDLKCNVYGLDQKSGIDIALKDVSNIKFQVVDFETDEMEHFFRSINPEFVIFSDVIEHLEKPDEALENLYKILPENAYLLVSTPDRKYVEILDQDGPPKNPRHVQEWEFRELQELLEDKGFKVKDSGHLLPRTYKYDFYELLRLFYRLLRFKKIPDARSCMYFLLTK